MPLVVTGDPMTFEGMLFDLNKPVEYYVEADDVRSPTYRMKVVELPAVSKLELEYVFPAYTGLPPQKVEIGGDVAALRGTEVRVHVTPTMATPAGAAAARSEGDRGSRRAGGRHARPAASRSTRTASITIELDGPRGEKVTASPKYTVDAIEDQPPAVSFEKPKRDVGANPVEEVFLQAKRRRRLRREAARPRLLGERRRREDGDALRQGRQAAAGSERRPHGLSRGAGRQARRLRRVLREGAATTTPSQGRRSATSDIYFIKVLPFNQQLQARRSRTRVAAVVAAGAAAAAAASARCPSSRRKSSAATFNVERDRVEDAGRQVQGEHGLHRPLAVEAARGSRGARAADAAAAGGDDENFRKIAELLPKAVRRDEGRPRDI